MKKPMVLFRCIAEALVKQGIREWVKAVPGGEFVFNVIKDAHDRYREQRNLAEAKEDIIELIQADPQTVQLWATESASQSGCTGREQQQIETYLMQIPAAIRQSQKRPDDPSGRTLSGSFQLAEANDLAKLLPPGPPKFVAGDDFPGKGGWKLERLLGIGGFGEVWLARHRSLASLAPGAVKFCRNGSLQHEAKVIDRLLGCGKHANIVTLNDADLERDEPWLLYDYIEGGDLGDLIHRWAGLPIAERQAKAIEALTVLAGAISYFHGLTPPIVHRDLKPANILRDQQDKLYITDFGIGGIAAQKSLAVQSITTTVGKLHSALYGSHTPLYASPQQKAGGNPSPQDDVHALGVIGYQLLTGQMEQGVGSDLAEDLAELGVTGDLIAILKQCTAQKAERRYANAVAVLQALQGLKKEAARPAEAPKPAALPKPAEAKVLSQPDPNHRYTKISNKGEFLSADAKTWSGVYDKTTRLWWEVHISKQKYVWNDTQNRAAEVNHAGLCGKDDWRVPNIDELKSLVIKKNRPTIDNHYFPNTPDLDFWSSSPGDCSYDAWLLHFNYGNINLNYKSGSEYVRLVCGGQ